MQVHPRRDRRLPSPAALSTEPLDYSTQYEGRAGTDAVAFRGSAEKCVFAIHGALMLGTSGVPEAIRYLKAWTDAALSTETEAAPAENVRAACGHITADRGAHPLRCDVCAPTPTKSKEDPKP